MKFPICERRANLPREIIDLGGDGEVFVAQIDRPVRQNCIGFRRNESDSLRGILGNKCRHVLHKLSAVSLSYNRVRLTHKFHHCANVRSLFLFVPSNSLTA